MCGNGELLITEMQLPGKVKMKVSEILNQKENIFVEVCLNNKVRRKSFILKSDCNTCIIRCTWWEIFTDSLNNNHTLVADDEHSLFKEICLVA